MVNSDALWWLFSGAIHADRTITAKYTLRSGGDTTIPVPTQPTTPGEIMSEGEEPLEAEVELLTAEAEAEVQASSTHTGQRLVSTQTITHEYLTQSGRVMRETIRTDGTVTSVLDFIYDESGKPFALKYTEGTEETETYYYILNLQGDVVGLTDANGNFVAQYTYDAWGNLLSSSGGKAEINPLRYRGYYYDTETGFYYLQSRYYDPVNHRFINADVYASTDSTDAVSCNMFAYCGNNPVGYFDPEGNKRIPCFGLDLPPGEGIEITIDGESYLYYSTENTKGETYEYWYDRDGNLIWARHHSDHGNSNKHNNPHDHPGTKDSNGENSIGPPTDVNSRFCAPSPNQSYSNYRGNFVKAVGGIALAFAVYTGAKWIAAVFLAPMSGGTSLIVAAATP